MENGIHTISYYELDENGTATDNLLFLSESEMRLNKSGSIAGQFLFTPYTKTVAGYLTPFGKIVFGVETESYHLDAKEDFLDAIIRKKPEARVAWEVFATGCLYYWRSIRWWNEWN